VKGGGGEGKRGEYGSRSNSNNNKCKPKLPPSLTLTPFFPSNQVFIGNIADPYERQLKKPRFK